MRGEERGLDIGVCEEGEGVRVEVSEEVSIFMGFTRARGREQSEMTEEKILVM